jgi:signal transduction histidine kinase
MPEKLQQQVDHYQFLIGFVAHEVRNPLAAITLYVRLMLEGKYGALSPKQLEVLDRILANASRIEHMTDDFMNLTRVESQGGKPNLEETDLVGDLIEPAINSLMEKHLFEPEQRGLFVADTRESVRVLADRPLLAIVFDNLFYNAVKYGREGGLIGHGWRREGEMVEIRVRNEGQGVRPEALGTIFEKFIRINDPAIPPRKGTGLGLYNVRRIVELHGGTIRAESNYGRDFTVVFTLPAVLPPG